MSLNSCIYLSNFKLQYSKAGSVNLEQCLVYFELFFFFFRMQYFWYFFWSNIFVEGRWDIMRLLGFNNSMILQRRKLRIQKTWGIEDKMYQIDTTCPVSATTQVEEKYLERLSDISMEVYASTCALSRYSVHCTVYNVKYTVYNVQCTLTVHCTPPPAHCSGPAGAT